MIIIVYNDSFFDNQKKNLRLAINVLASGFSKI
jgi:hypothetical protein